MLNITEINNTITELENGDTTFANCQKLASLYIVRDKFPVNAVEHELSDILPQYKNYCAVKRKYQLNELTVDAVINSVNGVCKEIQEFIEILYGSTDTPEERERIRQMIQNLQKIGV